MDKFRSPPLHAAYHLSQRPDRFAQKYHLPFEPVDFMQHLLLRFGDYLFFQDLYFFPEFFEDEEITVDDGIDEDIGQIIGPHFSHTAFSVFDPCSYRIEYIPLYLLLKREDKVRSDTQAYLLYFYFIAGFIEIEHFQDDKEIVFIVLHFWKLSRIDDIFQGKGMEVEEFPCFFYDVKPVQAVDIDPCGNCGIPRRKVFINIFYFALLKEFFVILIDRDPDFSLFFSPI